MNKDKLPRGMRELLRHSERNMDSIMQKTEEIEMLKKENGNLQCELDVLSEANDYTVAQWDLEVNKLEAKNKYLRGELDKILSAYMKHGDVDSVFEAISKYRTASNGHGRRQDKSKKDK